MIEGVDTSPQVRLVALGEIVGTHGVRGLLRLHPANDASAASAVAAATGTVYLRARTRGYGAPESEAHPVVLASAQPHGRVVLLRFAGVDDIEHAEALIGLEVAIPESDLPVPAPGEYYAYQLEGLEVVTVEGRHLGTVESVLPTGGNDVLVVRDGAREHLIPVIADVIRKVDLDAGRVTIEPIAGLLEDA
jgi:16S rRNA processing protein RimM